MVKIKSVLNLLTYCIAIIGFVPLFPYLEHIPRILFPLALASGVVLDRKNVRINTWIPTVISLVFFVFYAAQFTRVNLVVPAVNLLVILLSVRLFSEKAPRNHLQIFALSLFSLTSSSLFSLSPIFLVYLFLMFALIAVSLVILTFCSNSSQPLVSRTGLRKILSVALIMPVAALPLMVFLFIILPRTQFPLWQFLSLGSGKETGFSEKVEPGSASAVGEVKNVAFRASCERLPIHRLYWRGIVLNSFEGNAWVRKEMPHGEEGATIRGQTIRQTIYPEPGRTIYLSTLNIPRAVTGIRYSRDSDFVYRATTGGFGRIKYDVVSVDSDMIEPRKMIDRNFYLNLPGKLSGRLVGVGKEIAAKGKNDGDKVSLLENFFQSRKLKYATTGLPVGENSLEEFLLDKGRGHCEFFASSAALLLRLSGVPARLVGGYYGGEYNDIGGYYVVTEEMAHVWVEAYVTGKGWVTIDPSRWAVNFAGARENSARSYLQRMELMIDAFSYYWNVAIINYDLERQLRLISSANIGLKKFSPRIGMILVLCLAAFASLVATAVFVSKKWGKHSREERVLMRFLRTVKKRYRIQLTPGMGLLELSASIDDAAARRFVALYTGKIYRDRRLEPEEIRELNRLIGCIADLKMTNNTASHADSVNTA